MAGPSAPTHPPCPRCACSATVANGHVRGRPRGRCPGCRRSFGPTTGTVMARLKTPAAEVAQALLVVLRRGSLRAAEEVTGHTYEPIARWLRRAAAHADALTDALVHDLHLSAVEVDACWSFVRHKGGQPKRATAVGRMAGSGGGA
jgi:transposase-like protein